MPHPPETAPRFTIPVTSPDSAPAESPRQSSAPRSDGGSPRPRSRTHPLAETPITKLIDNGIDYAAADPSMALIIGEARMGKTAAAKAWCARNPARGVYCCAPVLRGQRSIINALAAALYIPADTAAKTYAAVIERCSEGGLTLVIDEGLRLLGDDRRGPAQIELLRDLQERAENSVVIIATQRFHALLRGGNWQYEQFLGRIGQPITLPKNLARAHVLPILRQYIPDPGPKTLEAAIAIANAPGRLGILTRTCRVALDLAGDETPNDSHFWRAVKARKLMSPEE